MNKPFVPPYPKPYTGKLSLFKRFFKGYGSWIHTLFERSYTMKMGEIKLPKLHFYIPNETSLVKRILEKESEHFPKHRLLHKMLFPLIGNSAFSTNGTLWKHQRAMINPGFAHASLKRSFPIMQQATQDMLGRIKQVTLSEPLQIDPYLTHVTADIIYRTLFSLPLKESDALKLYDAFHHYQRLIQPATLMGAYGVPTGFLNRKLKHHAAIIHDVFAPAIKVRYEAFEVHQEDAPRDILASLLAAKHPETGERFSYQDLVDQISLIFLAGHETSASALTWALYLLASCPEWQEIVHQEIIASYPEGILDDQAIRLLPQTLNVFKETLRLYPPISFFMRTVMEETSMRNKIMQPDALIVISPWLLQRNENYWPCPHGFSPERFAEKEQAQACKEAYLPFGKGPRICVGAGFAQQEAVIILAEMVAHFRLSVAEGCTPEPISKLTTRPKHGVRLRLERRD